MMTVEHLTVERLANGLYRVFDYGANWAAVYNARGVYQHGAVNKPEYRAAVLDALDRERTLAMLRERLAERRR